MTEIYLPIPNCGALGKTTSQGVFDASVGASERYTIELIVRKQMLARRSHFPEGSQHPASMHRGKMTGSPPRRFAP